MRHLQPKNMSLSAIINTEMADASTKMTTQLVHQVISRLAEKYGFDADEALQFMEDPEVTEPEEFEHDLLSAGNWSTLSSFKAMESKETQKKYYFRKAASPEVMKLVELDSKPFGSVSEKIISELFGLGPRTSTQNDATFHGKKIEIKTARYWAGQDNCVWQHLEPEHDYEYALLVLLDFHGWKVWCIHKPQLMGLREKKIVTFQGKQGWWTRKSDILPYLTPIQTAEELRAFLQDSSENESR